MTSLDAFAECSGLIGRSPPFLSEIQKIPRIAALDAVVLVCGETGTGKELCALAIHRLSSRATKPFVPINCGAIPLELVENELFGHAGGAFTSAAKSQPGLIQEADGGTLFLDEIDSLPLLAQATVLRFLQTQEFRPLGSSKIRTADVRIIAATNADLSHSLREGRFRRDLYYRLNVLTLTLPPLRERRDDIPLLADHFVRKLDRKDGKRAIGLSDDALKKLCRYNWPGNVRELEAVIQRSVLFSEGERIPAAELHLPPDGEIAASEPFREAKARMIREFETGYIQGLLLAYQGNVTRAAEAAKKNRRAFWELIRKHKIDVTRFRRAS
jgi:two-component system, NtrC family, response regulator GlrR